MEALHSQRRYRRIDLEPPEIGILISENTGYVFGTSIAPQPQKLFVDIMNRSHAGVGIRTEKEFDPNSVFYLRTYNKKNKRWDLSEGRTRWIVKDAGEGVHHKIGAELYPSKTDKWFLKEKENLDKIMPLTTDYQFFRGTKLLKSISRDSICSLLNTITFKHVKAGQRFITQGDPGDICYIIQKGTCAVIVEKDKELIPVARMQAGQVVGEMALITGEPRSAHVDAETDMHLWCLKKDQFDQIARIFPELRSFLTDLIANWFENRPVTATRRIGKYVITDIIGKGGYGIVYRGVHEALGMPVAIKMMKHDMAMNSEFIKNFRNEARTIAKFNHENIVKVYDIEERFQTIFIVMEHLEGMSLRTLLERIIKLHPLRVVDYLLQICAGLQYAHSKRIVHQDIKPGNVLILPNEKIKILDFGLACPCGSENYLTGTPFYMSPEQIECIPVDERTDIFALGLTAYEMLTGHRPFPEEGPWEVMERRLKQEIPDPAQVVTDLPDELRKVIIKACTLDIDKRYQSIAEIVSDLKPLAKNHYAVENAQSVENNKIATMFLMYREEHQPALNRMMQDFCESVNKLGVACKAADFKEI